jgi:2-succinyl-5-enolpyruvyl-6-hydroxy-3-cyclohexene-1-carboxylate synthase
VDDYITLDRHQINDVSSRLSFQLDWHCRTQLSQYAEFLRLIQQDVNNGDQPLTVERLRYYNQHLARYWNNLILRIGPDIVDILASTADQQIAELFENLEKNNREKEKKYVKLPPEKIVRNRQYRMHKRLRYWFSNLTESQKLAVAEWSQGLEPIAADWIAHRRQVQNKARHLLVDRRRSVDFASEFLEFITNTENLRNMTYQQKIDINTDKTLGLLANLLKKLTDQQKAHFSNRLQTLVADLDHLSCDPTLKANRTKLIPDS